MRLGSIRISVTSLKHEYYDWEHLFESYKAHVNKSSHVLEIGSSNVKRTSDIAKYCHQLIGVELFPERVPNNSENNSNIKYVVGDWQNLSCFIKPESIDVVVSSHVIEHVPDDLKAINELYAVLKPGGVALLNTPNRRRLVRSIIEFFSGERKFPFWEHQREYTEKDLINLLKSSRFDNYKIIPIALGVHGGPIFLYSETVPILLIKFANFWEIHLFK